jgi:hypothetical protein
MEFENKFKNIEFGKFSPLHVECKDGKPTLEQLGVSEEDKNLLINLFNNKKKLYTRREQETLEYLDKRLDIPLVEGYFKPSYKALKRLIDSDCKIIPKQIIMYINSEISAKNGDLKILKWMKTKMFSFGEWTSAYAALGGQLKILKWLIKNNIQVSKWACAYAARSGHINVLKFLRQNNCPWDESTCEFAGENGHLEVLKWARENRCPWDKWTCICAIRNKNYEIAEWAKENGCPYF